MFFFFYFWFFFNFSFFSDLGSLFFDLGPLLFNLNLFFLNLGMFLFNLGLLPYTCLEPCAILHFFSVCVILECVECGGRHVECRVCVWRAECGNWWVECAWPGLSCLQCMVFICSVQYVEGEMQCWAFRAQCEVWSLPCEV